MKNKLVDFLAISFITVTCVGGFGLLLSSNETIKTEAQNRAGIKEGRGCYCDFITGWCEGLKVDQATNSSSC